MSMSGFLISHTPCCFVIILFISQLSCVASADGVSNGNNRPTLTLPDPNDYDLVERFKQQLRLTFPAITPTDLECDKVVNVTAIRFLIYTRSDPSGFSFTVSEQDSLKRSTFNVKKETKFIVHGAFQNGTTFAQPFVNAYLKKKSLNVVSVDWGYYSQCEYLHIKNKIVPSIGKTTADVIKMMIAYGSSLDSFHLIGHSFGAHVVSYAGQNMLPDKLSRITGADPAGPWYYLTPNNQKLSKEDADFVDVIHTNAGSIGLDESVGHADFYVNGGRSQPACNPKDLTCSHQTSYAYYVESIYNPYAFCASECANYKYYQSRKCAQGTRSYMGEYASNNTYGKFYVDTKTMPPYGFGC